MSVNNSDIDKLAEEFKKCQQILSALGDESRQHLILEMMQMENCDGVRVGEITERTHLSRPAVSHHIRILKQTGILKVRREGTKNYYYFDVDMESLDRLAQMIDHIKEVMRSLPGRDGINLTGGTGS